MSKPAEGQIQRYTMKTNARRALAKIGASARAAAEELIQQDDVGFYFVTADAEATVRVAAKAATKQAASAAPAPRMLAPATIPNGLLATMLAESDVCPPRRTAADVEAELAAIPSAKEMIDQAMAQPKVQATPKNTGHPTSPKATKSVTQNGVRRPMKGKCADVWNALDALHSSGVNPTVQEVKALNESKKWNLNNTTIEFYGWRKFHGFNAK